VAAMRSREVFLLTAVVFCFGVAWITSSAGLSLSLGAFLAGLVLSESEYSHQTLAQMLPFKDLPAPIAANPGVNAKAAAGVESVVVLPENTGAGA